MAWGIIMTAFTVLGMFALMYVSVTMESGVPESGAERRTDEAATEIKKAA